MVEPPAELRSAILAGARVSGKPRAAWWQRPQWLAMAAGVLLLFSAGVAVWPRASASAPFLSFVANDAHHSETHGGSGVPAENLQAKLTEPTTHLGNGLTADFDTLRSTGCRSISFQGHDVLEVCFKRDGSWFHCYIARPVDFPALAGLSKPVITELDHEDVAAWADSAHVYLVAGDVGLGALKRLL